MAPNRFDAAGYYAFNLPKGEVRTRAGRRMLVLDSDAMGPLISTAVKHGDLTAVRTLGHKLGEQVAGAFDGPVGGLPPQDVLAGAAAVLGLCGWGRLSMQQWGDAVVLKVDGAPALDDDCLGLAALLGGMLASLVGRDCACVPVGDQGQFVVVDPKEAAQVWSWSQEGLELPAVVGRLVREDAA